MKALKINNTVALTTGLSIPTGSIVIIAEGYANVAGKTTIDGVPQIPCQVITQVYKNLTAYTEGKACVPGNTIADFSPAFYGLYLSVTGYETLPTEALLIGVAQQALEAVYPGKIEEITI